MSRKLSDVVRIAKERLGEEPTKKKSVSPSLEHYIQRRSGPRGLSNVDDPVSYTHLTLPTIYSV